MNLFMTILYRLGAKHIYQYVDQKVATMANFKESFKVMNEATEASQIMLEEQRHIERERHQMEREKLKLLKRQVEALEFMNKMKSPEANMVWTQSEIDI